MPTNSIDYFHALDGRLRIGIAGLKRSPATAARLEAELKLFAGITDVSANPKTGNVLVTYDTLTIQQHHILDALHSMGYLEQPPQPGGAIIAARPDRGRDNSKISRSIATNVMKFALERAVEAIFL